MMDGVASRTRRGDTQMCCKYIYKRENYQNDIVQIEIFEFLTIFLMDVRFLKVPSLFIAARTALFSYI